MTLERSLGASPSQTQLKWAAAGRLLVGDPVTAVRWLERAAALAPTDADVACDLSAAYQIRGGSTKDVGDYARAIDAARRGIARNPKNAGCSFNLALSLKHVGLFAMADTAFSQAAVLEQGAWADEARSRARAGSVSDGRERLMRQLEPIVTSGDVTAITNQLPEHVDIVHELLERSVLTTWAAAIRADDRDAAARLQNRARAIAAAIESSNGDRHPRDLVAFFDGCTSACAEGWISHVAAVAAWYDERFADARKANAVAEARFGRKPSVVNASRILLRVTLARIDGKNADARNWMPAQRAFYARSGYSMATGRLTWQTALLESERGNFGGAVALYREAADWLARARDREGQAMVSSLLAEKYQQLGDFNLAWTHAMSALSRLDTCRELRQRAILAATAVLATADNLDEAALAFRIPLIERARTSRTAPYLARLLSEDATTLLRVGRPDAARERIQEAADNLAQIDDPAAEAFSRALVRTVQGRVLADHSPRQAEASFAEAAEIYRARGNLFATPVLELERGRVLLKAGDDPEAQRAFERGIEAAERERRSSNVDAERVGLLSARWDLYASLIDLQIRLKNEPAAIALLDNARAANLLEAVGTAPKPDPHTLSEGTAALEYAVLPSGVHVWVTARGDRRRYALTLAADAVERKVSDYLDLVRRRASQDELNRSSGELFDALIAPVRDRFDGTRRLVIVPDGPLHALPFAALYDAASRTVLVDRFAIAITPSLAFFRQTSVERAPAPRFDVVAVGSAMGRTTGDRVLPNLPAADREAGAVAEMYEDGHVLRGANATRARFLEVAGLGRILHFAGHALVDARDPNLSRLLVSPTADDAVGAVFATDISRHDLRGVKLVILSACETASGRVTRGEGVIGLARAFLKAGASSVIATLWPVDDQRAFELGTAIHHELKQGRSAADALRTAQMTLRRTGRTDIADWAASVVLGGDVTTTNASNLERSQRR